MIDPIDVAIDGVAEHSGLGVQTTAELVRVAIEVYDEARSRLHRDGVHPEGTLEHVRVRPGRGHTWTSTTVEHVRISGLGPYERRVETFEVTFDGGHPTNVPGYEMPFGVPGVGMEPGEVKEEVVSPAKQRAKLALGGNGWQCDSTIKEESKMGDSRLTRFELLRATNFTATWLVIVAREYLD